MAKILYKINEPSDLKKLSILELNKLAQEIRELIIDTVSKNGGHLAPNLGTVELTIALHRAYNSPKDKIIWDVGHQAYTHKILTGRANQFQSLRRLKGLSGYLKLTESKHDIFGAGHVGTAVSSALGIAMARDLKKEKFEVVSIIGDGSLTNGITYEGINNIGGSNTDVTVILNDNKWSISKNVGGIARYLEKLSATRISGEPQADMGLIFRSLGFTYFGPIGGHNIELLLDTLKLAKETKGPKLIHINTQKGRGYAFSENKPEEFHSVSPFILESGKTAKDVKNLTYTKAFGQALVKIAKKDKKVVAITAAMPAGTGVDQFAKKFPDRFFDAGIAEEHAVIFAAGLALQGFKPVVAIYSTFLQRAYDQILHDIALQKIPLIFALDRAGLVGADGPTHHGVFDLSYLRNIPNLVLIAPKDESELQDMLYSATFHKGGPIAIRYPRGASLRTTLNKDPKKIDYNKAEKLSNGKDLAILAIGHTVITALEAAELLKESGVFITVYNSRSVKPIDQEMIKDAAKIGKIITVEENVLDGGFGSAVLEVISDLGFQGVAVKRIGISDFVEHGETVELREICGLDKNNIYETAIKMVNKG